jgi:predicted  nucleic acid-binding Zn-ribbon protein
MSINSGDFQVTEDLGVRHLAETIPYQERITTLEQKLTEVNTSQITLSKELTTTRKRLKQKQQEIDNLKLKIINYF